MNEKKKRYNCYKKNNAKKKTILEEEVNTNFKLEQFLADVQKFSERSKKRGETERSKSLKKSIVPLIDKRGLFENGLRSKTSAKEILGKDEVARLVGNIEDLIKNDGKADVEKTSVEEEAFKNSDEEDQDEEVIEIRSKSVEEPRSYEYNKANDDSGKNYFSKESEVEEPKISLTPKQLNEMFDVYLTSFFKGATEKKNFTVFPSGACTYKSDGFPTREPVTYNCSCEKHRFSKYNPTTCSDCKRLNHCIHDLKAEKENVMTNFPAREINETGSGEEEVFRIEKVRHQRKENENLKEPDCTSPQVPNEPRQCSSGFSLSFPTSSESFFTLRNRENEESMKNFLDSVQKIKQKPDNLKLNIKALSVRKKLFESPERDEIQEPKFSNSAPDIFFNHEEPSSFVTHFTNSNQCFSPNLNNFWEQNKPSIDTSLQFFNRRNEYKSPSTYKKRSYGMSNYDVPELNARQLRHTSSISRSRRMNVFEVNHRNLYKESYSRLQTAYESSNAYIPNIKFPKRNKVTYSPHKL